MAAERLLTIESADRVAKHSEDISLRRAILVLVRVSQQQEGLIAW
jgi:hypothetical protein